MAVEIIQADVLDWAKNYNGEKFHALLCDPPYEIGILNHKWDSSGIAFQPETWAAIGQHLYPGAFVMVFASARGAHRLACAIEDAGFIIHPTIFGWLYASGVPKAARIDTAVDHKIGQIGQDIRVLKERLAELFAASGKTRKQIDQECGFRASNYLAIDGAGKRPDPWAHVLPSQEKWQVMKRVLGVSDQNAIGQELDACFAAAERAVIGQQTKARSESSSFAIPTQGAPVRYISWDITAPATELAQQWAGHRYGLRALKPAFEPILLFQKPYTQKPAESIIRTGAGALNVEGSRIRWDPEGLANDTKRRQTGMTDFSGNHFHSGGGNNGGYQGNPVSPAGRWPANLVLQHLPGCRRIGIDRQRTRRAETPLVDEGRADRTQWRFRPTPATPRGFGDADGFEIVEKWDCVEECPVQAIDRQSGTGRGAAAPVRTGHSGTSRGIYGDYAQKGDDGASFYGDTDAGGASKFFYCADWSAEIAEQLAQNAGVFYAPKASRREKDAGLTQPNPHPTVKPLSLARWLATMLLPPAEYAPRRLLVPFSGTGTEVIGALMSGWDMVLGIECSGEYTELSRARLRYWQEKRLCPAEAGTQGSLASRIPAGAGAARRRLRSQPKTTGAT